MNRDAASPGRIACFRTDRIGDVMLTLPALAALRRALPGAEVTAVVSPATAPLLEGLEGLAAVVRWDPRSPVAPLVRRLKEAAYDAAVVFHPRPAIAWALARAGVPVRIGTAYRWYSPLFTHRVRVHRRANLRHEAEYNFELLAPLGIAPPPSAQPVPPALGEAGEREALALAKAAGAEGPFVVVHPRGGGSALNAGVRYYAALAARLRREGWPVVVTAAGSDRPEVASAIREAGLPDSVLASPSGLPALASLLKRACAVVGPSTGPLHVAAGLGVPTVALYPPLRSQTPARWRPLGGRGEVLVPHDVTCPACLKRACPLYNCVETIPHAAVSAAVRRVARA